MFKNKISNEKFRVVPIKKSLIIIDDWCYTFSLNKLFGDA